MLRQTLIDQMYQALKSRDANKVSVLRFLVSEIKRVEIDAKHELEDSEIINLLRKEVKRRQEAIDQYRAGGREDIVAKEMAELQLIQSFLPTPMSQQAIEQIIIDTLARHPHQDFGQIMRQVMAATQGQADGKLVSSLVRAHLAQKHT